MDPEVPSDPSEARMLVLRAIADPTRLAILERLYRATERCHRCLERDLDVPANRMSFHLKVLREAGLVDGKRSRRRVCYRIAEGAPETLHAAIPGPPCAGPKLDAELATGDPTPCARDVHEPV